jgi:hypothetical protein
MFNSKEQAFSTVLKEIVQETHLIVQVPSMKSINKFLTEI